jgi:glutamate-1-semialdehyde 2,1-aminomutase
MTAGATTLRILTEKGVYSQLDIRAEQFFAELEESKRYIDFTLNRAGSMFTLFFGVKAVRSFADAQKADQKRFARFFKHMLEQGIFIAPSQMEANFISAAHTENDLMRFVDAVRRFRE